MIVMKYHQISTAGQTETLKVLLANAAEVDKTDVKAQTPLFIAMVNQHWECGEILLKSGADPNGNEKNLCTPLAVMAQRGYYEGLRLLCRYGADTEDVYRLMTGKNRVNPGICIPNSLDLNFESISKSDDSDKNCVFQ